MVVRAFRPVSACKYTTISVDDTLIAVYELGIADTVE